MRNASILVGSLLLLATMAPSQVTHSRSPERLRQLLAEYDRQLALSHGGPASALETLSDEIDREAAQKDAAQSRLFWYTDLSSALVAARAQNKPLLSLRLLGRLDEELSCANSRFFRKSLYNQPAISSFLREQFILHWQSLRPVPVITIDYGDGRTVKRTITGNSIHYVLLPDGQTLDALPGLYDADTFAKELIALRLNAAAMKESDSKAIARHWMTKQQTLTAAPVQPERPAAERPADRAARLAVSKNVVERPTLVATRNPSESVARDTQLNQRAFRPRILQWLLATPTVSLDDLNARVYRELFQTPLDDPDMGLNPPDEAALVSR